MGLPNLAAREGAFPLSLLGWGLLTAWGLVSLSLAIPPIPGGVAVVNAVTSAASLASLLALGFLLGRGLRFLMACRARSGLLSWVLAVLMFLCSLGNQLLLGLFGNDFAVVAAVILQVFSSVAYVGLMALWLVVYAARDPEEVERGAIWSTALCAVVVALARLLPYAASVGVWVLLPLASCACIAMADKAGRGKGRTVPCADDGVHAPARKAVARTVVGVTTCALVLGLPMNAVGAVAVADSELLSLGSLGGVALAAALVLLYTSAARRISMRSLYAWLQPMAAVALLCAALPASFSAVAGVLLAGAGQWALYVFVWIYAAENPEGGPAGALRVYVAARAAFDGGGMLSALLGWGLFGGTFVTPDHEVLVYVLFGAVVLLVLTGALRLSPGQEERRPQGTELREGSERTTFDDLVNARASLVAERYGLSEREAQILVRLLRGYSTAAVRNELGIAKGTVDTYISRIYRKCGVHGRQQLVELAERQADS